MHMYTVFVLIFLGLNFITWHIFVIFVALFKHLMYAWKPWCGFYYLDANYFVFFQLDRYYCNTTILHWK